MKVLLVNTFDRGGAAKACIRLHLGLLSKNVESYLLLKYKSNDSIPFSYIYVSKVEHRTLQKKIKRKTLRILKEFYVVSNSKNKDKELFLSSRDKRLETFTFPNSGVDITKSEKFQEADIINLHWVSDFLDFSSFFKNTDKPVVWTLHDMNPFLGGEHYNERYLGIDDNGFPIKRVLNEIEKNEFNTNVELKILSLQGVNNLHIVALCNWMAHEVKKSKVFSRFPIHIIPNGIDSQIFQPRDKHYSRQLLGLPHDKKVLLFVSDSVTNSRKGYEYLLRSLAKIDESDVLLCSIGIKAGLLINDDRLMELGEIHDERMMSVIYSAADVFIIPSLMDNLPNTVIESIMCGTPVIGFPVGGITDLIINGENGYLTNGISVDDLVNTINKFLNSPTVFDSETIRLNATKKYCVSIQAQNYFKLFDKILNNN